MTCEQHCVAFKHIAGIFGSRFRCRANIPALFLFKMHNKSYYNREKTKCVIKVLNFIKILHKTMNILYNDSVHHGTVIGVEAYAEALRK